jgi:leucyl/phenylalanyl-tRNA--protein transferase
VFDTATLVPNRSLRRALAGKHWRVTVDEAFGRVMRACAAPRSGQQGTWIGPAILDAYTALHTQGHAHSVEVWEGTALAGGVYGVSIGRVFCGESMFSARSGGSKMALVALASLMRAWDFPLLDAQVSNAHLASLGAREMPREVFLAHLRRLTAQPFDPVHWRKVPARAAADYL